jgi:hypothetical protein
MESEAEPRETASRRSRSAPANHAQPLARDALARRKRRDAAAILPMVGLVAFASPLLDLFAGGGSLLGLPVGVLYIFGTWFALIVVTARLSRRLLDDDGER